MLRHAKANTMIHKKKIKKRILPLLLISSIVIFSSCYQHKSLQKIQFQGEAQGTYYMITYFDYEGRNFQTQIDSLLKAFDQSLSLWVPNSILSKVNRNENVILDKYFKENFKLAQQISRETDGAFDCSLGPLIEAWGFGFKQKIKLTQHKVDSLKKLIGYNKITIKKDRIIKEDLRLQLNFNAIAQGYSVDMLSKFLDLKGIKNYIIDVGGEIIAKGKKPNDANWIVGIQKPTKTSMGDIEAQERVELFNKAFVTSGSYRKYYEENGKRYSHMIDPTTGYPVTHGLLSVTVLANTCAEADGYATAFMVMGLEKSLRFLKNRNDLDAYFIYSDKDGIMKASSTKGLDKIILKI
jgi:thiamine biosynthesis lipoprotein